MRELNKDFNDAKRYMFGVHAGKAGCLVDTGLDAHADDNTRATKFHERKYPVLAHMDGDKAVLGPY